MKTLISILKIYGINKILLSNKDSVDIVFLERKRSLTLNDWINLDIALKRTFSKEINYLSKKDALYIYNGNLSSFEEVSYE